MTAKYTCIWEFHVRPEHIPEFIRHYESRGTWARLFSMAEGYLGTQLLRDRQDQSRFVTLDHWASESLYREFRQRFQAGYTALDRQCEGLTLSERQVGEFAEATDGSED